MDDDKSEKIRRHLPPGTGEYSVGCVDIMSDNTETGVFFRLYYPIEKTDIFVSTLSVCLSVCLSLSLSLFVFIDFFCRSFVFIALMRN